MSKILVNLVTHSAYADECKIFLKLFEKNWQDCPYDFSILIVGKPIVFNGYNCKYLGEKCQLPEAIYKEMQNNDYDYCISFLGDAYINSKIDNDAVTRLINTIEMREYEYCCLIPRIAFRFCKKDAGEKLRYISSDDVYNMCFVAFVASKKFVEKEFCNAISDLEFERKYLKINFKDKKFYANRVILTENLFNLVPGIDGGKWNRHSMKKIKKNNPEIEFTDREVVSLRKTLINDMIHFLQILISRNQRKKWKKILEKVFHMRFSTEF